MSLNFFTKLLPEIRNSAARSSISKLGFSNPVLNSHLLDIFGKGFGEEGSFIADPVFEATFGWQQASTSLHQLSGNLLNETVVSALDRAKEYNFSRSAYPYTHQLEAWQQLLSNEIKSVVITSGTGSGKTECFMVPVLSRLATQLNENNNQPLRGVRALFLYPLNALIQSQRERLKAWTDNFGDRIQFCLYNGMTPEILSANLIHRVPNEVQDRTTLRNSTPPILVTNPTMLEYMLVRSQDDPIIQNSNGKLEWIILDEAHNYIGSQAAELSLLLRRVLHSFGVNADQVRFVATSATINSGDPKAKIQLQEFLAKLAGVQSDRVVVIEGKRQVPNNTTDIDPAISELTLENLKSSDNLLENLNCHSTARHIRDLFIPSISGQHYQTLSTVKNFLESKNNVTSDLTALQWLDLLTTPPTNNDILSKPFLPLRIHLFHNTLNGLWACANINCTEKNSTKLAQEGWHFGMIYLSEKGKCNCGAPIYPVISCVDCNSIYLDAILYTTDGLRKLIAPPVVGIDEFILDNEPEDEVETDDPIEQAEQGELLAQEIAKNNLGGLRSSVLIVNQNNVAQPAYINTFTQEFNPNNIENRLQIHIKDLDTNQVNQLVLKCPCCKGEQLPSTQYRKPFLGAPFLLNNIIPTLLEQCPEGDTPLDLPARGRRMITFTDSRQGTARISAQLQLDSEKTAVRSGIYKKLMSNRFANNNQAEIDKLNLKINEFRGLLENGDLPAASQRLFINTIDGFKQQIAELQTQNQIVSFTELGDWLANQYTDVSRWITKTYQDSEPEFRANVGLLQLREILLCREFARRAKRHNNLENLGLVSVEYIQLNQVQALNPVVTNAGLNLSEWKDFLKICLDFFVRHRMCLNLPSLWNTWGGNRVVQCQVLPPNSNERSTITRIKWPRVRQSSKSQNPLIRLLATVLNQNIETPSGRNLINDLLQEAWNNLVAVGLLVVGDNAARYLDLQSLSFKLMTNGWICPLTQNILDTTLRGITPYLPKNEIDSKLLTCKKIVIPLCTVVINDFQSEQLRLDTISNWLNQQPQLQEALLNGHWSNLQDKVLMGRSYFKAVEHSAQQSGAVLQQYESGFKQGKINLMSCSTTMEMGVDIGGINTVAMTNVPPHPANYLQRAGRAGRRSETRSVAFTVCKNNPHDQHVFNQPDWPFITKLPTPNISLSSPLIVQRHINSMVLAYFLKNVVVQNQLNRLTLENWMLPANNQSYQQRFVSWCECFEEESHPNLTTGVAQLLRRTVFENRNKPKFFVNETGMLNKKHAISWFKEYNSIQEKINEFNNNAPDNAVVNTALNIQKNRLIREYLLRELASNGFLPGYGFPTDIISFDTLTLSSLNNQVHQTSETNQYKRRELPSRDSMTALREYAPGANVVLDGLVYESAGITLNWHAPAGLDEVNEIQNIRTAWRCRHCGANGTHVTSTRLATCPECMHPLNLQELIKTYLEPAGFSVDFYKQPHNDITLQKFISVEAPWISGEGEWISFANAKLGSFRATNTGSIFHFSSGPNKNGYAVCLDCGKAAPMTGDVGNVQLPNIFTRPHNRLRGGARGRNNDRTCAGSYQPFKIKSGLIFGREYTTDVLEIILNNSNGVPCTNTTIAFSIVVALRDAIAKSLGIQSEELGCGIKEIRNASGQRVKCLQIYDIASAGYSTIVLSNLVQIFRTAKEILQCSNHCDAACQSCLLSYDTRFKVDQLDRKLALEFLSNEWLDSLDLPVENRLYGEKSQADFQTIGQAITAELNNSNASQLFVYLNGHPENWDLPSAPLKDLLYRLALKTEIQISLLTSNNDLRLLSRENLLTLNALKEVCNIELLTGSGPETSAGGNNLASILYSDGTCRSWGCLESSNSCPDDQWGILQNTPIIFAQTSAPQISNAILQLPQDERFNGGVYEITTQLNGPGNKFGEKFWGLVSGGGISNILPENQSVISIHYDDRYLKTPISCAIFLEVISALKQHCVEHDTWSEPRIYLKTLQFNTGNQAQTNQIWNKEWVNSNVRDSALTASFIYAGMNIEIESVPQAEMFNTIHGRKLEIKFENNTSLVIIPDQGFSYWRIHPSMRNASFSCIDATIAAESIANLNVNIVGNSLPTLVATDLKY